MCIWKWTKRAVLASLVVGGVGFLFLGDEVFSYVSSSVRSVQQAVKDQVPVEFEIQRARDTLEQMIPEMRANLKVVAEEEVEVAHLEKEIARERQSLDTERSRLHNLRERLSTHDVSYEFAGRTYTRTQVVDELAQRFERFRMAEQTVAAREKLLANRRAALDASIRKLENASLERVKLAAQIEALEGQFRLVQAQSQGSRAKIDDSKLAQTQRMLTELRKRLEVAQRVLAREARFVETIPIEVPAVDEDALLERIDKHLSEGTLEEHQTPATIEY